MKIGMYLYALLTLSFGGCVKKGTADILEQMGKAPVQLCTDQMACVIPDSVVGFDCDAEELKLVVFSDTTNCSQCYISHLMDWNDLLQLENNYPKLSFYFVMAARKNEGNILSELLRNCGLRHVVYVDTANVFLSKNPHINVPEVFHTFLLDKDNRVVLVGNPLKNQAIYEIFMDILVKSEKNELMSNSN